MSTISPEQILSAIADAEDEWPVLVGKPWPKIEPQYRVLRHQLEKTTGAAQMRIAADLVQLLSPFAAARDRLNDAIAAKTDAGAMVFLLADLAIQLGLDPAVGDQIRNAAQPSTSNRFIWQSGPTKATSLKLANAVIGFEFGMFSEFLAGLITTSIKGVIGEANGILKAAGVLMMIASLYKAVTIKFDEREATVFYGFAQAGREANEDLILAHTNRVRQSVSLKPLKKQELGNALNKLAEIRSIERVGNLTDRWHIVEDHKAKHFS